MRRIAHISLVFFMSMGPLSGQFAFDGQASIIGSYSPEVSQPFFLGARYLPELNYTVEIDSSSSFAFEASGNLDATWNGEITDGNLSPYRLWAKYARKQFEFRLGLQKIEFGSAVILRPLQWFNQIDPRDPLALTNGVYGALSRYYFLNNVNIWVWGLYGNEDARGFDVIQTNGGIPEFGGRIQVPVPKGELGLTYHKRVANTEASPFLAPHDIVPEHRLGFDGKWDLGVGLWVEAAHQWKLIDLGPFTNQTSATLGIDYTLPLGSGLTVILEQMILSSDEKAFEFDDPLNFTASSLTYPLTFFDNISAIAYFNYEGKVGSFLLNYEHQFKYVSLYVMAYYNPDGPSGIQQNELVYSFAGPGVRLMAVYNH